MGRRYLENLDEKIIHATISLGAKYFNVSRITAKEVGKLVDITDATVFEHFQTKDNLLFQAYLYAYKTMVPLYETMAKAAEENKDIKQAWLEVFNFMLNNSDLATYYSAYRYTFNLGLDFSETTKDYIDICKKVMKNANQSYSDDEYLAIWGFAVDSTINFARLIAKGNLKNDEKTIDLAFNLIFGILLKNKNDN